MARIPLEDTFSDVINKAQRGLRISDAELAAKAEVSAADLADAKSGVANGAVLRRLARHLRLGPNSLETLAEKTWYPKQPIFPHGFAMFNTPHEDMTVNSYLIWDVRSRSAAAIDTGADSGAMIDLVQSEKLRLEHVFLTHTHEDHVAGLAKLAAATSATVWSSELEPVDFPGAKTFKENVHFHLGPLAIKTLLTSGHSPGQTTFFVTGLSWPVAFVGDSLFASSMGGSATHYAEQHRNNLEKIFTLSRNTVLACGHGPLTTLAEEKRHNPFFAG